jgi:hypothetical protein
MPNLEFGVWNLKLNIMFCPKCGTQNPETGRFCRKCGADLGNVSAALTGNLPRHAYVVDPRKRAVSWETAITKLFTGLAFLLVAIILGVSGKFGAQAWWFWMLIPAFGALGSGVAQFVQLKKLEKKEAAFSMGNPQNIINPAPQNNALSPTNTDYFEIQRLLREGKKIEAIKVHRETYGSDLKEAKTAIEQIERGQSAPRDYVQPPRGSIYETGELETPPSVTEGTTRHLQMDSEGETMTLPKK